MTKLRTEFTENLKKARRIVERRFTGTGSTVGTKGGKGFPNVATTEGTTSRAYTDHNRYN